MVRKCNRPIAEFQAIRFKIATMATKIEAARQLMYFVCHQIDSGRRCDRRFACASATRRPTRTASLTA